ncbi:MAG: FAD-dependent oxidoreductase, partial [Pseudomonadota bacterium]
AARPAGYRVGGRITPLADQTARDRGEAQARDGQRRMPRSPLGGPATWRVGGASAEWAGLFAADIGAAGWLIDSVSAQIDAERYAAALLAAARGLPGLTVTTGWSVEALRGTGADWRLDSASGTLLARQVIIAAGWHAGRIAGLIGAADDPARYRVGAGIPAVGSAARADRPVKGQAARLSLDPALRPATAPETMPAVQAPGVFIVHHGGGAVAVGATSEAGETDCATDAGLDGVIARAVALMPALVAARVERRWAGIRPRPPGTLPRIGQVADAPGLWHASGGFKIGLALAHHAGLAVAAAALGIEPGAAIGPFGPAPRLPAAFAPGPVRAPA